MSKIVFTRDRDGEFDVSDDRKLRRAAHALRQEHGTAARIPLSFKAEATRRLIRAAHALYDQNPVAGFYAAAMRAARAHPDLLFFDRAEVVKDGEPADLLIEDES